jgi:hypothetical protein
MKVLVACEYSGVVRDAFLARGHDAWSCDLEHTSDSPHNTIYIGYKHQVIDCMEMVWHRKWDLLIAHPPCTYLCNSGVCWLTHKDYPERWKQMIDGAVLFRELLAMSQWIPRVCVENPIMHGYAKKIIGDTQTQIVQPWQFGHGETKATCLWLRGLPELEPTDIVEGREQRLHKLPPSEDRWKLRSKTYQGFADAMASQWG